MQKQCARIFLHFCKPNPGDYDGGQITGWSKIKIFWPLYVKNIDIKIYYKNRENKLFYDRDVRSETRRGEED